MTDPTPLPTVDQQSELRIEHEAEWNHARFVEGYAHGRIYRGNNPPVEPDPPPENGDVWLRTSVADHSVRGIFWWESGNWHEIITKEHRHLAAMRSLRGNITVSGGGTIKVSSTWELSWDTRIILMWAGRSIDFALNGFFDILMPPPGAVIPGVGGAVDQTVTSAGIPLATWNALYYILPLGQGVASKPENFRLVRYTEEYEVPDDWVFIAGYNSDNPYRHIKLWDGRLVPLGGSIQSPTSWANIPLASGWTTVSTVIFTAQYRMVGDRVELRGRVVRTSGTGASTVGTLPVGFRPLRRVVAAAYANDSANMARLDVLETGEIWYVGGGIPTDHMSLDQHSFSIT